MLGTIPGTPIQHRYHINLFWSDADGCWIADVPDLAYCSAHGDTPAEALREVQVAMTAWLEARAVEGHALPKRSYRPAMYAANHAANDDDVMTIGGPMRWFSVSLTISADDLDPDEVTLLLGVEPDRTQRKGVRWPVPVRADRPDGLSSVPARIGQWEISLRLTGAHGCDVAAAVAKLLDRVAAVSPAAWRRACAGAKARVFVGLTLDTYNRGFGLGPAVLRRAAELGLDLDFDVYDGTDDDDPVDEGPATG